MESELCVMAFRESLFMVLNHHTASKLIDTPSIQRPFLVLQHPKEIWHHIEFFERKAYFNSSIDVGFLMMHIAANTSYRTLGPVQRPL